MRTTVRAALAAIAVAAAAVLSLPAAAKGAKPLFAGDEVIHITIQGPISKLPRTGKGPSQSAPGTLTVQGAAPETLPIVLSTRGITRRSADICSFPPLRVEFSDKPPQGSLFHGQKRLKLVTHCQPQASAQQYVLLEYAGYRIYNTLTPVSFRARLASVDYQDAAGHPMISRIGYFLEDIDDVAKRNDLARYKTTVRVPIEQLNPHDAARFAVFEDMIGNLDWAMTAGPPGTDCCHNSRLLSTDGGPNNLTPVPYDFDFSGMVDAPYATPPAAIKLANVRIRRYRGYCVHTAQAQAVAADFASRRAALLAVFNDVPQLDDGAKKKATAYLSGFFDLIATPADAAKLVSGCLG